MNYKFELTEDEANVVLTGLGELPAKVSLNLIQKLQSQAAEQLNQNQDKEQMNQDKELNEGGEE